MPASNWVNRLTNSIPAGQVLDLACDDGRHAMLLAVEGRDVLAVDYLDVLTRLTARGITTLQIDLETDDEVGLAELFSRSALLE